MITSASQLALAYRLERQNVENPTACFMFVVVCTLARFDFSKS